MSNMSGKWVGGLFQSGWTPFAHVWQEEMSVMCRGDVSDFSLLSSTDGEVDRLKIAPGAQVSFEQGVRFGGPRRGRKVEKHMM